MRHYGRFTTDIWDDPKFRALTVAAQRAYFMLSTQADITAAGTLALRLRRWSRYASDTTSDALSDALSELAEKRFVVVDYATEELLVRSFAQWDGGINNEKRRPVVIEAAMSVESPTIRAVLAQEMRKLGVDDALCDALSDSPSDTTSGFDRVVVTKGEYVPQPTTPLPQPATRSPVAQRATRLTRTWTPDPLVTESTFTTEQALRELDAFLDYWCAKSGKDATKLDWQATWRNWLRRARQPPNGRASTTDSSVAQTLALADRLERKAIQ